MLIRKQNDSPLSRQKPAPEHRRHFEVAFWSNRESIDFHHHKVLPERGLILFGQSTRSLAEASDNPERYPVRLRPTAQVTTSTTHGACRKR